MADQFAAGSDVRVREVLHGSEWASWDEHVVGDDGVVLATVKADGTFLHWYVNFETPYVRQADCIDVNDLQLDIDDRWWSPWDGWALVDGRIGT